ncbi:uncharacterized protein LOC124456810 isoform X2 [Xenia sp. Carnegie-2017]|nr:uncharacterized protein LOC124456810 isoform X2 [Xenia sp. Carnegie-2017]
MGNATEITEMFHEDDFFLRTVQGYNEQCQKLDQGEHFKKTYGLNQFSLLNNSKYYHVIGGLPPDAMHDILEGVLQYIVKELLKEFIFEKRYFKLDDLNKRMQAFDFGYHNDTNKPAPIQAQRLLSSDNSLKQHANQMWCLGLHLPFLIGDLIEVDDQHWGLLCTLLQIVRISFTPIVSREQVSYLQILIQKLLQNFKELFPECSIIPKMHYMVHMPRAILQ